MSFKEVYDNTLVYFNGNEMLTNIWLSKYCMKNKNGEYLEKTPDDKFRTIAREVTRVEKKYDKDLPEEWFYEKVYNLLKDFGRFIPGGSVLYGVGNKEYLSSLGNCFVIGNKIDSYGSICFTDQEQVQLMKRRGGVGHDLSHLRPNKTPVNGCAGTSTGAFSFAPRYSHTTREVAQDGRRGALMLSAHINHPDIESFITMKDDNTVCTGANISVKVTDEFMNAVVNDGEHYFRFPIDSESVLSSAPAREIFRKIVHQAWKNGEPGVLFWDTIIRESPADCYKEDGFETISTNPCGEIPLSPYDSCRLGHCNLFSYVYKPFVKGGKSVFEWDRFKTDTRLMTRVMDDIIELELEKIDNIITHIENLYEDEEVKRIEINLWKKIRGMAVKGRRIGLGMLGEGDTVAALGYRYASEECNTFLEEVHKVFTQQCYEESIKLAKERGAFPIWKKEKECDNPFIRRVMNILPDEYKKMYEQYGRRNIGCLTLAPTGTVSQFANRVGVTSGMEPVFEIFYKRRRKINSNDTESTPVFIDDVGDKWEEYMVIHPMFKKWFEENNSEDISTLTTDELKEYIKKSPYSGSTANEVDVLSKIDLQGRLQKWIDHSISITHNLPNNAKEEDIARYYVAAWRAGCKGCTVYRDGSRCGVLVRDDTDTEKSFKYKDAIKRPVSLSCDIHKLQALKEDWIVLIGLLDKHPYEIFAIKEDKLPITLRNSNLPMRGMITKRKKGKYDLEIKYSDTNTVTVRDIVSLMENDDDRTDTRHFSLDLRHGIDPRWIIELFDKQSKPITSFEKAISRVLKKYIGDGEKSGLVCPNCGSKRVIYSSGCPVCKDCGYSKCG